jgi:hypothetical protein
MKQIPVGRNGVYAVVDDEDYERLIKYRWRLTRGGYAIANVRTIYMHKLVKPASKPFLTDHKNRNRLDNRRCNLRKATYKQNRWNSGWRKRGRLFVGTVPTVYGKFESRIVVDGKMVYLGSFDTEHLAALAYDFWATHLRGKRTATNFTIVSTGP